ncbi:MAG: proprotein convertase P-domain-containing protein, partial [Microcoleus sp. PH2017_07_MST_O_A]|nr:proprotein convertase P-domain-containing protein [Microcoleus sp. PH2017_07_MST_O_A]
MAGRAAVDPKAAVEKAANWTSVDREVQVSSNLQIVKASIPDGTETGLSSKITINEDINVEKVEVVFDIDHNDWGDLTVKLKSPDGTNSLLVLALPKERDPNNNYPIKPESTKTPWLFTSNRSWGESSKGDWTLEVIDENGNQIQGF